MWKLAYVALLAVRLYFALSPSYIHPDEHFQGPEVVAGTCFLLASKLCADSLPGELFNWHSQRTWEFTSAQPIRSFFPLWVVYALPMKTASWLSGQNALEPHFAFQ